MRSFEVPPPRLRRCEAGNDDDLLPQPCVLHRQPQPVTRPPTYIRDDADLVTEHPVERRTEEPQDEDVAEATHPRILTRQDGDDAAAPCPAAVDT